MLFRLRGSFSSRSHYRKKKKKKNSLPFPPFSYPFITQICSLANDPYQIVADAVSSGGDAAAAGQALCEAGVPVWCIDDSQDSQIYLPACASPRNDGSYKWKITDAESFEDECGSSSSSSSPFAAQT